MAFMCQDCGKMYGEKQNFQRHRKQCASSGTPDNRHLCPYCGKQFARSDSLRCHISTMHLVDSERRFQGKCDYCGYTTCHKSNLTKHLRTVHVFPRPAPKPKPYPCSHCSAQFSWLHTLQRHLQKEHNAWSPKPTIRKCPLCMFISKEASLQFIYNHFEKEHNTPMIFSRHKFSSVDNFDTWKNAVEKETVSLYRKMKTRNENYIKFVCNRTGKYVQGETAKRRRCKMNGFCPARITGRTANSGEVNILFQETHVGHDHERRYARLTPEEKLAIKEEKRLARLSSRPRKSSVKVPKLPKKNLAKGLTEGVVKAKRTLKPKDSSEVGKNRRRCKLKRITEVAERGSSDQVSKPLPKRVKRSLKKNANEEEMGRCITFHVKDMEIVKDEIEATEVGYLENGVENVIIDTGSVIDTVGSVTINEDGDIIINALEGIIKNEVCDAVETGEVLVLPVCCTEEVCDTENGFEGPCENIIIEELKQESVVIKEDTSDTTIHEEVICEPIEVEEVNELIAGEEICVTTIYNPEDKRTASVSFEDRKMTLLNDIMKHLQEIISTEEELEYMRLYFQPLLPTLGDENSLEK